MAIDPSKVRAIALQKTVLLVNNFISNTTNFLNMCVVLIRAFPRFDSLRDTVCLRL